MRAPLAFVALLALAASPLSAQDPAGPSPEPAGREKIAWYGTLDAALAEAERTERPIFLLSARPEFREVPGFW